MKDNLINVIIIEDNDLFRNSLFNFINSSDEMNCEHAFINCEDAFDTLLENTINPDVVLLDIGLPGMSGVEGIKHFKKIIPDSKIIMLTIQDDNDNIFNSLCSGASGYLLKDSDSDNILIAIKEVVNGGSPINSSIASKVLNMFRDFVPEQKNYQLSLREAEILKLLTEGLSKRQISNELFISHHTVDSHIRHIYEKLEVHSSCAAVAKAIKENLI